MVYDIYFLAQLMDFMNNLQNANDTKNKKCYVMFSHSGSLEVLRNIKEYLVSKNKEIPFP